MSAPVTKKLINKVENCVDENLEGYVLVNQGLCLLKGHRVVLRKDIEAFKQKGLVTTVTGGGSGHEPAFAGYVGKGMMSAAVLGSIFASPSPTPILAALRIVGRNHPAGVIMVYNNYTGDRLNFGIALERAKAEGIKVGMLINRCDCALLEGRDKSAGRRGLIGIFFLIKIVGAMAEEGKSFEEIMHIGSHIIESVGTLGVCLSPCSLPGGPPMFNIASDEMEIGLGLHGEAGVQACKVMNAHECVSTMLEHITASANKNRFAINSGDHVAAALNNLGSTTEMEMAILIKETIQQLERKGVFVDRAYVNRYATSQEMAGFSITLIHVDTTINAWLDAPTKATAWVSPYLDDGQVNRNQGSMIHFDTEEGELEAAQKCPAGPVVDTVTAAMVHKAIEEACVALSKAETKLNQLDSESGDGDCGTTIKTGCEAILERLESGELPTSHPKCLFTSLGNIMEDKMGGSSGALYSLFFTSAASVFDDKADFETVVKALSNGVKVMGQYGGASPGDRTMLDPLHAACEQMVACMKQDNVKSILEAAVQAAENSAQDTISMQAGAGRASYVNQAHLTKPDPGATGVAIWMRSAYEAIRDSL